MCIFSEPSGDQFTLKSIRLFFFPHMLLNKTVLCVCRIPHTSYFFYLKQGCEKIDIFSILTKHMSHFTISIFNVNDLCFSDFYYKSYHFSISYLSTLLKYFEGT